MSEAKDIEAKQQGQGTRVGRLLVILAIHLSPPTSFSPHASLHPMIQCLGESIDLEKRSV
jgi:hypothetical protein